MDYFIFTASGLSILAALISLLLRSLDSFSSPRARGAEAIGQRGLLTGFAIAGTGVIALVGAALPTFHEIFDFGTVAALGAVLVALGIGFAVSLRLLPFVNRKTRPRPARAVPRLSDL